MRCIVTIPVGHGDGYFRAMSNRAQVIVRGRCRPIVDRIFMNQILVNLGPTGIAYNGDEVFLMGQADSSPSGPQSSILCLPPCYHRRRAGGLGRHDPVRGADEYQHAGLKGVY